MLDLSCRVRGAIVHDYHFKGCVVIGKKQRSQTVVGNGKFVVYRYNDRYPRSVKLRKSKWREWRVPVEPDNHALMRLA